MKPRTTDLLNQHQSKVADHTEVLFQRFREFARHVAARDLRRMSQPHGHTSSAASTGLRQTLNWIAQRPDLISFDDSSTFEAAVAVIVHRRCIDAVRAAKRREARLRDSPTSRPAPAGTSFVAAEQLQLIKPIIEETVTKILAPLDGFRHAVVTWSLFDGLTVTQIENALQRRIQEIRSTGSFQGRMPKRRTIQLWIQDARRCLLRLLACELFPAATQAGDPLSNNRFTDDKELQKVIFDVVKSLHVQCSDEEPESYES